ncbi:Hypothetical protein NTJ_02904 [Nesidiocoris tenuis]|uniref:Uncharacterized protein n=1 Tax=Nesidiocoris tenuis TaxID=355587 RepID=A0ABN7AID9_9HEMI|nr:Hypothetical protein NTJ_02904 [Nesidiocoris tenuis]
MLTRAQFNMLESTGFGLLDWQLQKSRFGSPVGRSQWNLHQISSWDRPTISQPYARSKLQELLRNSEGIVENLKKQKLDLSREVGEANGKFADLQKSYDTLRIRLHHSLKQLKKFKKDFIKANEEKTVLQAQLQDYVSKVRGIEDLLLQKEQEREFMFEQFREMTERSKGTLSDSNANTRSHVEEDAIHCSEWQSDVNILSEEESSIESNLLPKAQRTLCKSDAEIQTDLLTHPKVRFIDKSINSTKETEELEAALSLEKKTTEKLHDVIKVTREEAIEANMKNEQLTLQLEAMKITVQQLEAQVKTIASSMGNYRRQCMEEESLSRQNYGSESDASRERRHYNCSESSHSTML